MHNIADPFFKGSKSGYAEHMEVVRIPVLPSPAADGAYQTFLSPVAWRASR